MTQMDDKRRQLRLPFSAEVQIQTPESTLEGKTNDICTTGLRISDVEMLALDTVCDLEMKLHSGDQILTIKGQGKVVRHIEEGGSHGMGIQFTELDEYSQEVLWRVIRYNSPVTDEDVE